MPARRFWILTVVLLGTAMAVRTGTAIWWQQYLAADGRTFAMGDSDGYWHLAQDLAAGRPYEYGGPDFTVFRAPVYPWLLSWIVDPQDPTRHWLAGRILGCALGTAAVAIVMAITARAFDRTTALVAGLLAACYPGGITTSVLILSEAPFMPLMMLVLAALSNRGAYRAAIGAGLLSGIAILVRPSWLLFLPFYYGLCILFDRDRVHQFRLALCAGASIAVVMTPWWIRNYQVTGHFVPTTLQVGASLYDGLHPQATGASDTGMEFTAKFADQMRAEAARSGPPLDSLEYRLNARLAGAAMQWAGENPGEAIRLAAVKVQRTWWPWPSADEIPGGAPVRWMFATGSLGILIPGLIYAFRQRVWATSLRPYIVPAVYFTLLHAVFVGSVRYRQPAVFALVVFAAPQYVAWYRQIQNRNQRGRNLTTSSYVG